MKYVHLNCALKHKHRSLEHSPMQGARLPIQQNALSLRQKVYQHDRHTFNSEQGLRSIRRRFFVVTEKWISQLQLSPQ